MSMESADKIIARMQRELGQQKEDYDELHDYVVNKVDVTTQQLTRRARCKGCNKLKAADMNGFARVNKDMLNWKLRFDVLPHLKFFGGMQVTWQPEVVGSFSQRLRKNTARPDGSIESVFWEDEVMPLANRVLIEIRGGFTRECRKQYTSEYLVEKVECHQWRSCGANVTMCNLSNSPFLHYHR